VIPPSFGGVLPTSKVQRSSRSSSFQETIRDEQRLSHPDGLLLSFLLRHKQDSAAFSIHTHHSHVFAKQTHPSRRNQSELWSRLRTVLTRQWGSTTGYMATVAKVDSIIKFATHLQQSLLHHDKPIKDVSMYLASLPFQHEDLLSFDRAKLNKQGLALWNICARLKQNGQLLAQKELISRGNTYAPKREPY
jgi:hypothetical protein